MDLNTVEAVLTPARRADLEPWRPGDAWLAGGTWLFSEPQPGLRRLVDLGSLGWEPIAVTGDGLSVAATCTFARLARLETPAAWRAAPLIGTCCRALVGSFKVWNAATIGGNLCMALPAGPMMALACALDASCEIWTPDGGARRVPAVAFVLGPGATALAPGEILRRIDFPADSLRRRSAFRRIALSPNGRSAALLIGTADAEGFQLTVTAAVRRPVRLAFGSLPAPAALRGALAGIAPGDWYDDPHGAPDWRAHVAALLAEEIRTELAGNGP